MATDSWIFGPCDGRLILGRVNAQADPPRIVVYTGLENSTLPAQVMAHGRAAFVSKSEQPSFLLDTIADVAQGRMVFPFIDDCLKGAEGPHNKNYNTRWIASLVAECHRIMSRGGIFLDPGDRRPGYQSGRLRLAYECNPITFLTEQAGGAASDGHQRILEIEPGDIHQRVPMIFGSINEVALVDPYYRDMEPIQHRSQLFGTRGLFKA